jgi:lipid II isoglutaminyl synthase (glutamine-hydrolysing)
VHPKVAFALGARLANGSVLVSGTNGKTTTTRLIAAILRAAGHKVVHNRAGANLMSGVTTALLDGGGDIGLFEIDEAHLPMAVAELRPRLVLCLNLFRDQLDRYGELNTLAAKWAAALAQLDSAATALLNADDPLVASLGDGLRCKVAYFGLDSTEQAVAGMQHAADSLYCPRCGTLLEFTVVYYGHLGHYHCPSCKFARPAPDIAATEVKMASEGATRLTVSGLVRQPATKGHAMETALPGLYNVYNVLAASAAADLLGVPADVVSGEVQAFAGAFGRTELIDVNGKRLRLMLAKNPVGYNEVIRTLLLDPQPLHVYLALNDRIADGEDVSWIWDVDFEQLTGRCQQVLVGGTRAEDLAVRLKYAGFPTESLSLAADHAEAIRLLIDGTPAGGIAYAVPTYTAMLDLRKALAAMGVVRQFWED